MNNLKLMYLTVLAVSGVSAFAPATQDSIVEISRVEETTAPDTSIADQVPIIEETKFFGDYTVGVDEVVNKKIRVIGGNLTVFGTVIGQIIVVGGDVYLKSSSIIKGRIITLGGTINQEEGAIVSGKTIESNLEGGLIYREVEENEPARDSHFNLKDLADYNSESWVHAKKNLFQYNRQEGVVLNLSNTIDFALRSQVQWTLGYRSDAAEKIIGRLTIEHHFLENRNLTFYLSFFNQAKTDDGYRLPDAENSLAMVLGRQDFYDRWDETGWEFGTGIKLNRIKLKASYSQADHDSLKVRNVRSVFEKTRTLRPDIPGFKNRKVETLTLTAAFRTENYHPLGNGAALLFNKEFYKGFDSSDPVYNMSENVIDRTLATAIIVLSPGPGLTIRTRFMGGMSSNEPFSHRLFHVGGLGSVSAHPYKVQSGDMMVQANVEFFLRPLDKSGPYLKLFADGGHAWNRSDYGFGEIMEHLDKAISSYGIGIGSAEISDFGVGLNIAIPSFGSKHTETTVRINYSF